MFLNRLKMGVLCGTLCAAFLLTGCMGESEKQEQPQAQQRPAAPAPFIPVEKKRLNLAYEYPARIVSSAQVAVMARVRGTLMTKNFTEGEFVKKGSVLFKIDPRKYQALVDKANAQVAVAEATLKNAERNHKRVQALFREKAVSEQERDNALSEYEVAKAQLLAAKAQVNDALIDLDYTSVEAPISGIAGKKMQDVGDLVGNSATDSHLVTITRLDPVYVEFSIPDMEIDKVRQITEQGEARIVFEENRKYAHKGKVDFFDVVTDQGSSTVALRATFENPDRELSPGRFVRIVLEGVSEEALVSIPQKAVMQSPQGPFVYVIKEGKATFNPVQLGDTQGTMWVIKGGLENGQQVIIDNLMKIRPNAPVQPVSTETKAKSTGA